MFINYFFTETNQGVFFMEQKHIDDLDESFLGEEFIDEEDVLTAVESNESPAQRRKSAAAEETFTVKNKPEKERKTQKTAQKAKIEVKKAKTAVQKSSSSKSVSHSKSMGLKAKANKEKEVVREVPEITITPVKQITPKEVKKTETKNPFSLAGKSETKSPLEFAAPPVDPWKEEKEEKNNGWTEETSTWKAITGIVVVLLVLSVFTQGFRFSSESSGTLSLQEAQEKTLNYVNSYLLRPPFTAEAQGTEEVDGLYKVTLSVAGEVVDSYLTRDGKLFFPQGFAVAEVTDNPAVSDESPEVSEEVKLAEEEGQEVVPAEENTNPEGAVETAPAENSTNPTETAPVAEAAAGTAVKLSAKKWVFTPTKITVSQGKPVTFTITPADELSFTFAIPGVGVEQKVDGETSVTFTPEKMGSFDFLCSSCEDWRGMKGTLVVVE